MIEIRINGEVLRDLTPIKEVRGIEIKTLNIPVVMGRESARNLTKFLYAATQKCTGVITYNNVIIDKTDIREIRF